MNNYQEYKAITITKDPDKDREIIFKAPPNATDKDIWQLAAKAMLYAYNDPDVTAWTKLLEPSP